MNRLDGIVLVEEKSASVVGCFLLLVGPVLLLCVIAAAVVFLSGCPLPLPAGAERPPNQTDLQTIDKVIDAWRSAGEPWTAECRQQRRDRMVVIRGEQHVFASTGFCASRGPCCGTPAKQHACGCDRGYGCAAGVTTYEGDIIDPFAALSDTYRVQFWLSAYEDEQTQRRVLAHEAVHWLARVGANDDDRLHRNPVYWGTQGYESAGW